MTAMEKLLAGAENAFDKPKGMAIVKGDRENQFRCINSQNMLVGLITLVDTIWRVEFLMRVEGKASSQNEAFAFAEGCWAMAQAMARQQPIQSFGAAQPPVLVKPPRLSK
jgi:hypothetical protein